MTLTQVIDPATGADQFATPDAGKRFVATVLTIKNIGGSAIQGDANSDGSLIGSDNQTYTADFNDVSGCTNFNSGSYQLAPGESADGLRCVPGAYLDHAFQVPLFAEFGFLE